MTTITNHSKRPLGLHSGVILLPGVATPVDGWAELSKNRVIAAWVDAGVLTVGDAATSPAGAEDIQIEPASPADEPLQDAEAEKPADQDEKDALLSELRTLGVNRDRRASVEKLRELLAEAKGSSDEA